MNVSIDEKKLREKVKNLKKELKSEPKIIKRRNRRYYLKDLSDDEIKQRRVEQQRASCKRYISKPDKKQMNVDRVRKNYWIKRVKDLEILKKEKEGKLSEEDKLELERIKEEKDKKNKYNIMLYHKNKKSCLVKRKIYRDNNRDKINERIECEICKRFYTRTNKSRHMKSKKHLASVVV